LRHALVQLLQFFRVVIDFVRFGLNIPRQFINFARNSVDAIA